MDIGRGISKGLKRIIILSVIAGAVIASGIAIIINILNN